MRILINIIIRLFKKIRYSFIKYSIQKKYTNIYFGSKVYVDKNSIFEGYNYINSNSIITNSYIGKGSYIAGNTCLEKIYIGRFCAIGQNVRNYLGNHPSSEFVSIHPCFYSTQKQAGFTFVNENRFQEHKYVDKEKKYVQKIGNDVWIGNNVILMDGIIIGNGAIIGTGSIVTKDVDPYSIVAGIPAKLIRYRFSKDEINFLIQFKWWNKEFEWILKNVESFNSISQFMDKFKN